MMISLGIYLAWSTFVLALKQTFGLSIAQTQTIFGTYVLVVTMFMLAGSHLEVRIGPRVTSFIGGIIFGTSFILAGYSDGSYSSLLVIMGICAPLGAGICYMCPVSCVTKWFPQYKSMVIGTVVAGYGASAIIVSRLGEYLLARQVDVLTIFKYLGFGALLIVTTTSLFLQNPPAEKGTPAGKFFIKATAVLKDRKFWGLFCGFFPASCVGLMSIGNIKPLGLSLDLNPVAAGAAVTVISLFNTSGRVIWGLIGSLIDGKKAILVSLISTSIVCLAQPFTVTGNITFQIFAIFAGFNYGACLVLYAAEIARAYGAEKMGVIYSTLVLSNGLAGFIAPPLAGKIFDMTGTYTPAFLIFGSVAFISIFFFYYIYRPDRKSQW